MKSGYLIKILACLVLSSITVSAFSHTYTSPRHTKSGLVSGVIEEGIEVYKGIPYAADTSGENRWHPPKPAPSWDGILQADTFGPSCAQFSRFPVPGQIVGSEDCLSLSIYTSGRGKFKKKKPVMVWIHGGGFKNGSSSDPSYNATKIAKKDVIVVSINYRLDFLGRFAHPAISAAQQDEHLGNYALMDQIAALKWVKRNIKAFGGDPKNVTIFGQSAGGVAVNYLMGTPDSKGLFKNAIAQSGGVRIHHARYLDQADSLNPISLEQQGLDLGSFFGIANDARAPDALRDLSLEQLIIQFPENENSMNPVVDGTLVSEPIGKTFYNGRQHSVNYMGGGTSHEMAFFLNFGIPLELLLQGSDINEVRDLYPEYAGNDSVIGSFWASDMQFLAPHKFLAQQMYKVWKPGYNYYFDYLPTAQQNPSSYGVPHGGDVLFTFGNMAADATAEDIAISEMMMTAWTNFAKYGNPNEFSSSRSRWRSAFDLKWLPTFKWYDQTTVIDVDGIRSEKDFEEIKSRMDFILEVFEESMQNL